MNDQTSQHVVNGAVVVVPFVAFFTKMSPVITSLTGLAAIAYYCIIGVREIRLMLKDR